MEFFNTNADESKYAQALQEYSSSLASKRNAEEKEDAKVDDYNDKLQSVLEPIGAKLVEEPARDLIKGAVKGIARRITKKGEEVVKSGVQRVADRLGVNPEDLVALRTRVTAPRTLGKLPTDIPKAPRVNTEPIDRKTTKVLKLRPKPSRGAKTGVSEEPVEESAFGVDDDSITALARSTITKDQGLLDQLAPLRAQLGNVQVLRDFKATADIPEEQLLSAKPEPPLAKPDTQLEQGQEPPLGSSLEDGAEDEAGDVGKSIAKQATKQALKTGVKEAAETTGEELTELGTDAALGSEFGPAGTIVGGLIGLGTLLGGVFGGKHHHENPVMPINPSTTYGI
ncbi:MAG: hypothetical protein HKN86_05280 [Acidimicrobiia bacterium]|nr:hypothetical protein [Acidimicrobiia bacterium]